MAAAKGAGRLGAGFFPERTDRLAELVDIMRQTAADAGRDPATIEVTTFAKGLNGADPLDAVGAAAAAGVDRLVVPAFLHRRNPAESLAAFGETVIAPATSGV